ncbi:MAG: hydrogenase maturation nickel metallochaperone HypA [Actinomycetes bacterium]
MHELGLCESVLDTVERRAAGRRVSGVTVRVGALHRVVDESMQTAFAMVSTGTVADGAALSLVHVPVRVSCLGCGLDAESGDPLAVCPRCSSTDLDLSGGDDLLLESITVAAPEEEMSHVPRHPG